MKIQKYKAKIHGSNEEVIGYISEIREYLGSGIYGTGTDYLISVTEKSMPNGKYGVYKVIKESIEEFNECVICSTSEQSKDFNYLACSEKCYNDL